MKRVIHPLALGATLFVPANHRHLADILNQKRLPHLKSVVIDTEDGLHVSHLKAAIVIITELLAQMKRTPLYVFIRPRDSDVLQKLLHVTHIKKIDGFILPKFGLESMNGYLELLGDRDFYLMTSIEGAELFDIDKMRRLKERLDACKKKVLLVRFGAEDMLRQLGLQRTQELSLYEMLSPSQVMTNLLHVFKISGYEISGSVYPFYHDEAGFIAEVRRDLQEGFISKTVIHPSQIEAFQRVYRVLPEELQRAQKIVDAHEINVFGEEGFMFEVPTQLPWAQKILLRAHYYGISGT
jgi:citrate lyase beta subunit